MQTIIFGGAFDPPHNEHKKICCEAMKETGADLLVLVPTYMPPHKDCAVIDFSLRKQMLEAAFSDCGFPFEISTVERDSGHTNYSSETLKTLAEAYESPMFLIGGDSLLSFDKWHNPEEILQTMPLIVAGRDGFNFLFDKAESLTQKYGGKIRFLNYKGADVSSTVIRAKLYLGIDAPIDGKVKEIIDKNGLFCEYRPIVEKLKARQSPRLFFHSIAVALRAVDLNSRQNLGLDFEEVFLAGLLHDNSKEMLDANGLEVPKDALESPVLHQFLGAIRARTDFDVNDENILNAIRYHTTAKPDMTALEKLIYASDMLSEDRDFDGLDILVREIYADFEEGFFECLEQSYNHVLSKGGKMYPLTEKAYEYYGKKHKNKSNINKEDDLWQPRT